MGIKNKILKYLISFGIISSVALTSFSTYSVADSSVSSEVGYNVDLSTDLEVTEEEYATMTDFIYPGKEFFDPIDTSSLLSERVIRVNELADETYHYGYRDAKKCREEYENVAKAILAKMDSSWSDFRKLLYLHDYICENTVYDYTSTDMIKQTAYGCLVLHTCVCDGYSRAFYDLANRAGVETYYVLSNKMNHAWNVSKIDGKFYYIDCTWDGTTTTTYHTYFLKSESYMKAHSHNYNDIEIPAYATVNHSNNIPIYGMYNNKKYDEALFTKVNGPVYTIGNTDRYYVVEGADKLNVMDNNTVVRTVNLIFDPTISGNIQEYVIRGDKIFLIKDWRQIYYGTLGTSSAKLKLLIQSKETGTYSQDNILRDLKLVGNKLNFTETIFDYSTGSYSDNVNKKSIDVSSIINNTEEDYYSISDQNSEEIDSETIQRNEFEISTYKNIMNLNDVFKFDITFKNADHSTDAPIWISSNAEVAIVNSNGEVYALSPGETIISCQVNGVVHQRTVYVWDADAANSKVTTGTYLTYRVYNPNSGEHFWTKNYNEVDHNVGLGWKFEEDGWVAPDESGDPVYRLYNPNAGDHHYTMKEVERDYLVSIGWNDEGIAWYSAGPSGKPLYRLYNPNAKCGSHHYTLDESEKNWLETQGWTYEGIAWYAAN